MFVILFSEPDSTKDATKRTRRLPAPGLGPDAAGRPSSAQARSSTGTGPVAGAGPRPGRGPLAYDGTATATLAL